MFEVNSEIQSQKEDSKTGRCKVFDVNSDIHSQHGVDALQGDATAPAITTQAEKSAPNKNVEKEGNPQRTKMQENLGGDLRQSESAEPGKHQATAGPAVIQKEGKTPMKKMINNNNVPQGVDALYGNATTPGVTTKADVPAPKNEFKRPYLVSIYHVLDKQGIHRFLTMNSHSVTRLGGIGEFERILATQFRTFELLGTSLVAQSRKNRGKYQIADPEGVDNLRERIIETMAAYPNSSRCIEPWLPAGQESKLPWPNLTNQVQLTPMPTFKKELGNVNLDDGVVVAFSDEAVADVVKPEFVSIASVRGGALLKELKESVRRILEPQLIRAMEGTTESTKPASAAEHDQSPGPLRRQGE